MWFRRDKKPKTYNVEKDFSTPLGVVTFGIVRDNVLKLSETKKYKRGDSEIYITSEHKIEIIKFKIETPLYNGGTVSDSIGYMYRIERIFDGVESIEVYCLLHRINNTVDCSPESGERLASIMAESDDWVLHMGTIEDDPYEAANPSLFNKDSIHNSEVMLKENGLCVKVPRLQAKQLFYHHYIAAFKKSDNQTQDIDTWLAVDQTQKTSKIG